MHVSHECKFPMQKVPPNVLKELLKQKFFINLDAKQLNVK